MASASRFMAGSSAFGAFQAWPSDIPHDLQRRAEDSEMTDETAREAMEYDVVIVGAGPAGLASAIRLKQRAAETGREVSVAVVEKGSEIGAHILSGAVVDPVGLDALIP